MQDIELIHAYAQNRSDAAFQELVRRYVNLVYSSALRQVRNASLAEDVTQATFLVLARKAHRLRDDVSLPSWLLTVTRYAANDAIKSESRRKRHEQRAAAMNPTSIESSISPTNEAVWGEVAPMLDDAVGRLNAASKTAIVLRYFQHKSYKDVAEEMNITEATARQRVSRAVEQLRSYFTSRGIVLSALGLKTMIRSHAVAPAPPAMTGSAASMGTQGVVLSARHLAMAQAASIGLIPLAAKWGALAAIIVIVSAGGLLIYRSTSPRYTATVAATAPATTSFQGVVLDADGKPVEGAEVLLAQNSVPAAAYGSQRDGVLSVRTGSNGSYELPRRRDATAIVVRADQGYAQVRVDEISANARITLSPWARIEGTLRAGGKLRSDETVDLFRTGSGAGDWDHWHVTHEARTKTDFLGRFVFSRVIGSPKGDPHGNGIRWTPTGKPDQPRSFAVQVEPGTTAKVVLGGDGTTIKGRINADARNLPVFKGAMARLQSTTQPTPIPGQQPILFTASADGSFEVDDVPPGTYFLDLRSWIQWPGGRFVEEVAGMRTGIIVPAAAGGADHPIDLGTLPVHVNRVILTGDALPDFSAVEINGSGNDISLAQLRGKFVLLYIDSADSDTTSTTASLKPLFDRFATDSRFAMVQLIGGSFLDRLRHLPEYKSVPWMVAARRPAATTLPASTRPVDSPDFYQANAHRLILIDPEGRLITKCSGARDAFAAMDRALGGASSRSTSTRVKIERVTGQADNAHPFKNLANPTDDLNLARNATFSIVDGTIGRYSGTVDVLHDGVLPGGNDEPMANFNFDWGTLEGRLGVDLGRAAPIAAINTYSWHKSDRGPQVYTLYASDGLSPDFNPRPAIGIDPVRCGWKRIADVDSRPKSRPFGGRYAVSISDGGRSLGAYRYLLFTTFVTETDDDWGHTFFSEINVIAEGRP